MTSRALSVVMPAHNEELLLESSVRAVVRGLAARPHTFEVLIVENGSTDRTGMLAAALASELSGVAVRTLPDADYGEAIRTGVLAASGEEVAVFDVDYVDLSFLDRALERLGQTDGAGVRPAVVIGSKRAPGARDTRPWPRRMITAGFTALLQHGFGLGVSDTHGMKVMRRAALEPIARRCVRGGDLFDTELILRAERAGLRVVELPVEVRELRPSRTPIIRRILRSLVGLVQLRVTLARERSGSNTRAGGTFS